MIVLTTSFNGKFLQQVLGLLAVVVSRSDGRLPPKHYRSLPTRIFPSAPINSTPLSDSEGIEYKYPYCFLSPSPHLWIKTYDPNDGLPLIASWYTLIRPAKTRPCPQQMLSQPTPPTESDTVGNHDTTNYAETGSDSVCNDDSTKESASGSDLEGMQYRYRYCFLSPSQYLWIVPADPIVDPPLIVSTGQTLDQIPDAIIRLCPQPIPSPSTPLASDSVGNDDTINTSAYRSDSVGSHDTTHKAVSGTDTARMEYKFCFLSPPLRYLGIISLDPEGDPQVSQAVVRPCTQPNPHASYRVGNDHTSNESASGPDSVCHDTNESGYGYSSTAEFGGQYYVLSPTAYVHLVVTNPFRFREFLRAFVFMVSLPFIGIIACIWFVFKQRATSTSRVTELEVSNANLEIELNTAQNQIATLTSRNTELEVSNTNLQIERITAQNQIDALTDQLRSLGREALPLVVPD